MPPEAEVHSVGATLAISFTLTLQSDHHAAAATGANDD